MTTARFAPIAFPHPNVNHWIQAYQDCERAHQFTISFNALSYEIRNNCDSALVLCEAIQNGDVEFNERFFENILWRLELRGFDIYELLSYIRHSAVFNRAFPEYESCPPKEFCRLYWDVIAVCLFPGHHIEPDLIIL